MKCIDALMKQDCSYGGSKQQCTVFLLTRRSGCNKKAYAESDKDGMDEACMSDQEK